MDNLAAKWSVDDAALTEKLDELTYAEKVALLDAVERWWLLTATDNQPGYLDTLS